MAWSPTVCGTQHLVVIALVSVSAGVGVGVSVKVLNVKLSW